MITSLHIALVVDVVYDFQYAAIWYAAAHVWVLVLAGVLYAVL